MKEIILRLKNVSVVIDGVCILDKNTCTLRKNDFLGIIGPNGGGKTTFLKVILGLIKPTQGEVQIFGGNPQHACKRVGYVPQLSSFDPEFPICVFDVVLMGRLSKRGVFRKYNEEDHHMALDSLEKVDMLEYKDTQIGKLSGGERQRVFIARALASQPKLLLLDEPTASVDPNMKIGIYDLLNKLKQEMTIILVTHDMGVISSHVEKIACLNCQLHYHDTKEITQEDLEAVYHCPVDIIAHGLPHRVLKKHH